MARQAGINNDELDQVADAWESYRKSVDWRKTGHKSRPPTNLMYCASLAV